MTEFDLQPLAIYLAIPFNLFAFTWSSVGVDFVFSANNIKCFPSGRCLLVPSSNNLLVSIQASPCRDVLAKLN